MVLKKLARTWHRLLAGAGGAHGNASLLPRDTPAPVDPHPHGDLTNSEDLLLAEAGQRAASLLLQEAFSDQPSLLSSHRQAYDPGMDWHIPPHMGVLLQGCTLKQDPSLDFPHVAD